MENVKQQVAARAVFMKSAAKMHQTRQAPDAYSRQKALHIVEKAPNSRLFWKEIFAFDKAEQRSAIIRATP